MSDSDTTATSDSKPSLMRSTAIMSIGTLLSRITGFGRAAALAVVLGAEELAGSYNLANQIPNVIYELVAGGVLSATLVPVFASRFRTQSEDDAWHGVSAIATLTLLVVFITSIVIFLTAPYLVYLYSVFSDSAQADETRRVATFLLRLFAPQVAFYGFVTLATALLQVKRKFGPPMFAPIFNNVVVICMFLAFPHLVKNTSFQQLQHDTWGLIFLGLGTTAGVASMAMFILPNFIRITNHHFRFVFDFRNEAVRTVIRMSGWTIGLVITNQVSMWLTLSLSFSEDPGKTTVFLTAYTFFILPHGLFAVSFINALQPELSESWAIQKINVFRNQMNLGMRLILAFGLPTCIGMCLLAHPLITTLLGHGAMTQARVNMIANVVIIMIIGLPGFSLFIFFTRVFQSMQDAKTVFILYLIENSINVATAIPLFFFGDIYGLALSQSIAYTLAACIAALVLRARIGHLDMDRVAQSLARLALPLSLLTVVVVVNKFLFDTHPLVAVVSGILSGAVTYLVAAFVLKVPELEALFGKLRKSTQPSQ